MRTRGLEAAANTVHGSIYPIRSSHGGFANLLLFQRPSVGEPDRGRAIHPMFPRAIRVELTTHQGLFFSSLVSSVELRTADGVIAITPQEKNYLSLHRTTEMTLQIGEKRRRFILRNATAGLNDQQLTVLAEWITAIDGGDSQ